MRKERKIGLVLEQDTIDKLKLLHKASAQPGPLSKFAGALVKTMVDERYSSIRGVLLRLEPVTTPTSRGSPKVEKPVSKRPAPNGRVPRHPRSLELIDLDKRLIADLLASEPGLRLSEIAHKLSRRHGQVDYSLRQMYTEGLVYKTKQDRGISNFWKLTPKGLEWRTGDTGVLED